MQKFANSSDLATNLNDARVGAQNQLNVDFVRRLGAITGLSGLVGSGLALAGHALHSDPYTNDVAPLNATVVRVPIPVAKKPTSSIKEEEEDDAKESEPLKRAGMRLRAVLKKQAQTSAAASGTPPAPGTPPPMEPDLAAHIANALGLITDRNPAPTGSNSVWRGFLGLLNTNPGITLPVSAVGITSAALLGHQAVNSALKTNQRAETEKELEEAQKRYHHALLSNYKTAGAATNTAELTAATDEALDQLAEKSAGWLDGLGNAALATGTVSALGSGYAVWNFLDSYSKHKAIRDAIERRQQALAASGPASVIALPSPYTFDDEDRQRALRSPIRGLELKLAASESVGAAATSTLQQLDQRRQAYQAQMQALQSKPSKSTARAQTAQVQPPQLPSVVRNLGMR
jgi:hypothetical protein